MTQLFLKINKAHRGEEAEGEWFKKGKNKQFMFMNCKTSSKYRKEASSPLWGLVEHHSFAPHLHTHTHKHTFICPPAKKNLCILGISLHLENRLHTILAMDTNLYFTESKSCRKEIFFPWIRLHWKLACLSQMLLFSSPMKHLKLNNGLFNFLA